MLFGKALSDLSDLLKKNLDDSDFKRKIKTAFNLAHDKVGNSWDWKTLLESGSIVGIPNYKTGTASITKDNQTVILSSEATVDSDFAGRFFMVKGGENPYRIMSVNTSARELVLDQQIIEETNASSEYEIWKRYYNLPTEVRYVHGFDSVTDVNLNLSNEGIIANSRRDRNPFQTNPFLIVGRNQFNTVYEVGQITLTKDSDVVTGDSSQSFLTNIQAGNILRYGNQDYRIKRVETNDRFILYNFYEKETSTGAYSISKDTGLTVQLRNTPVDKKKIIPFIYQRYVYDLVNEDKDRTDTPKECDLPIIKYAIHFYHKGENSNELAAGSLIEAQVELKRVQDNYKTAKKSARAVHLLIPQGNGR